MGSDIHACVEFVKGWTSDRWSFPERSWVWLGRDYPAFGRLAGVRDGGPPVVPPRGLPSDTRYFPEDPWMGSHSFSWLTVDEWAAAIRLTKADWVAAAGPGAAQHNEYDAVTDYCRSLERGGYEVRVVFGFDN
jgi:hypothetical protein